MDSFGDASDNRFPETPRDGAAGGDAAANRPGAEPVRDELKATTPAQPDARDLSRGQKIAFVGTIALICAALIGMIWVATNQAIRDQRNETEARAKAWVQAQSSLLTEAARRELATIDRSLVLLESAWAADPKTFNISSWQDTVPGLSDVVNEYFIANSNDVIVKDTLPQAVGQGIGGAYATFGKGELEEITPNGQLRHTARMVLGALHDKGVVRRYLMYLIRPLEGRPGWFVGASYRSSALVKVFDKGALGANGLAALIDTRRGGVQAIAGPGALHPKLNVADTAMFKAFKKQGFSGLWIGPTGMDGVRRIQAFRRVPGRDLVTVVGIDLKDWMAPINKWALHARELAALASLLVVAVGGLVLWWLWALQTNRNLRQALAAANDTARQGVLAQMRSALESYTEGAALFGADWRLIAWNPAFANGAGLSPAVLRRGTALQELLPQTRVPPASPASAPATEPEDAPAQEVPSEEQTAAEAEPAAAVPEAGRSSHLVERMAAQLLRDGQTTGSAAQLLRPSATPEKRTPAPTASGGGKPPARNGQAQGNLPGAPFQPAPGPVPAVDMIALERAGMVDWSRTRSRVAEEFRLVQRQLITTAFSGPNPQAGFTNLVMVTSARPGEGKSFTALNLAGSIARQGDHSVLLIDADCKRDALCYPLGLAEAPGLLDLAANPRLDADTCIVNTLIDRLSILPVGRERDRSAELFASREMARLIQAIGRRYSDRLVILDAPPCLSTSDPAVLASIVGQVLMVVEAERTQRDEIEASIELIEACPNITMVLNKQRVASRFSFGTYASYYSS